jgi:hypothetical protein
MIHGHFVNVSNTLILYPSRKQAGGIFWIVGYRQFFHSQIDLTTSTGGMGAGTRRSASIFYLLGNSPTRGEKSKF